MPVFQSHAGQLYIVSAPSGVGKTSIIRAALPALPDLRFSVSCTTRHPRPGETAARDYEFLSREAFLKGVESGRFLEWAEVHGEYYGTDGRQIEEWISAGDDVLLDIDVQGARQVRCSYPCAQTIFIIPPSLDALEERLMSRGTESVEQIEVRLRAARTEMQDAPWYDYVIVNAILEDAVADLCAIVRAGRCRRSVQARRLKAFLVPGAPA